MDDSRQVRRFALDRRELLVIDDARDQLLTCESGELWVTQERDSRDIILPAGHSWRIDHAHPVVLSALKPAQVTLAHPRFGMAASTPRRHDAASVLTRILRWRFPALAGFPSTLLR